MTEENGLHAGLIRIVESTLNRNKGAKLKPNLAIDLHQLLGECDGL